MWRRLFRREMPLAGTHASGRPKTYSAESGYVYEYTFAGFRRTRGRGEAYVEYVFDVSGARLAASAVTVLLPEERLAEWAGRSRDLTASERYGIAKLVLKRALDRFPDPRSLQREVLACRDEVVEIANILDL